MSSSGFYLYAIPAAGTVELRNEIGRRVGCDLPATLVFDYPTVAAIAGYLASTLSAPAAAAGPTITAEALQADVSAALTSVLGEAVAPDTSLMAAGLDSLGELAGLHHCSCLFAAWLRNTH